MTQYKSTPKLAYGLLFFAAACSKTSQNQSEFTSVIQGDVTSKPKGLGQGFDSETEQLRSTCLKGNVVYQGISESKVTFDKNLTFDNMLATISGGLKLGASFGTFDVKGQADYAAKTAATDYSETFTVTSVNSAKSAVLTDEELTDLGKSQVTSDGLILNSVKSACGDEYVSQIDYGARFSTTVKFNFASKQDKEDFSGSASVSIVGIGNIEGAIKKLTDHVKKTSNVSIYVSQAGGAPEQINKIISSTVFSCSLDKFEECQKVLEKISNYLNDDFRTQLSGDPAENGSRGWAQLKYITTPFKERPVMSGTKGIIMVPEKPSEILTLEIKNIREEIYKNYKQELQNYQRAEELLNHFSLTPKQSEDLKKLRESAGNNRSRLAEAGQICFKDPIGCLDAKSFYEKNKSQYDETTLEVVFQNNEDLLPNTKYMIFNSVGNTKGENATDNENTLKFWQIPYNERLIKKGTESLETNYYNPTLYTNSNIFSAGRALFFDEIETNNRDEINLLVASAMGFNPNNMTFKNPLFISGDLDVFKNQFAGGWSSADFDGDTLSKAENNTAGEQTSNCAKIYGNVSQHYGDCWLYNLGADSISGDVEKDPLDSHWGPHVYSPLLVKMRPYRTSADYPEFTDGTRYTKVKRITRYVQFFKK